VDANLAPENTPFIVGLVSHHDLESAELTRVVELAEAFLRELKGHLRATELRLMMDSGGSAAPAFARLAVSLDIPVDALGAGPDALDLPDDQRVRRLEVPAADHAGSGEARDATIADILVRRCSLLLACWDGRPVEAPDDAAAVLFRFLGVRNERTEAAKPLQIADTSADPDVGVKLVYWLPAARRGGEAPPHGVEPGFLLAAGDSFLDVHRRLPPSLATRLADLDEFNAEYARQRADGSLVHGESLMSGLSGEAIGADAALLAAIDRQYVKADSLAGHMQSRSDRLFTLFGVMTFTMGTAYLVYDKITESRVLLVVYMLILFASLLAYYRFQGKRWFGKHLSYRALAETLRVRFYLALAGVDGRLHTENLIAMTGIDKFRGFSWISFVLHAVEPDLPHAAGALPGDEAYLQRSRLVEEAWVDNQYRYYLRKVTQMEQGSRRVRRLKTAMFVAILVDISSMFIFGEALKHIDAHTGLPVKNIVTFCSGFLAVVLGVWELRHNKMATRELLWQYRTQLGQFERARVLLRRNPGRSRREDLLVQLGSNSLMEIYLWAIHRYHREHSPPAAP
jgi:hypothetical protein